VSLSTFANVEIKMGIRSRIYPLYFLAAMFYGLILRAIPGGYRVSGVPLLLFMEPALLGFTFVGSIILFEKKDGVLGALAVTPVEFRNYYWAKALTMAGLSLVAALVILGIGMGFELEYLYALWGVLLTSLVYTFLGIGLVATHRSLDDYFVAILAVFVISILPFLGFYGVIKNELMNNLLHIIPSYESIHLLQAGFQDVAREKLLLSSAYLTVLIPIMYTFAKIRFYKYAVEGVR